MPGGMWVSVGSWVGWDRARRREVLHLCCWVAPADLQALLRAVWSGHRGAARRRGEGRVFRGCRTRGQRGTPRGVGAGPAPRAYYRVSGTQRPRRAARGQARDSIDLLFLLLRGSSSLAVAVSTAGGGHARARQRPGGTARGRRPRWGRRDLAAPGNDAAAPAAPASGGEGQPHCPSHDVLLDSTDKELKAAAADPASCIRRALGRPQNRAMETAGRPGSLLPRPCRVLVLLNPQGGKGKALQLFYSYVQPLLAEAEVSFTLKVTERPNHARELVCAEELGRWDALVIMSGDGLVHEVVNGLMDRPDWETAIQKPLCSLPGGTGNALAASLNYYAGYEQVTDEDLLTNCTLLLCRRHLSPMNLLSLHLASGLHIYSVLSLAWGFIADVDLESEKYRRLGEMRFTLGAFLRLAALRIYQGQLAYLPVGGAVSKMSASTPAPQGPVDTHLVPLGEPVPSHWTVVPEQDFVLVLVLLHTHLASNMFTAPMGRCAAGVMHLFYVRAGVSRATLLRLFLAMHKGKHMEYNCPHLVHVPVVAFRLEPKSQRGVFAIDGEMMTCEAVQGQVHPDCFWMVSGSRDTPTQLGNPAEAIS